MFAHTDTNGPGNAPESTAWAATSETVTPGDDARSWGSREPYEACVPPRIADLRVHLDPHVWAEAAEAAVEVARLDGEMTHRFPVPGIYPLHAALLRAEAIASSRIENIRTTPGVVALSALGAKTGSGASLVVANEYATTLAMAAGQIDARTVIDVQCALLEQTAPHHTGSFRTSAVWIGGRFSSPQSATFVPPQASRVPGLVDDFAAFTQRTDLPGFVQAAVAHAHFETVHPFGDGNGRTGRALFAATLRHAGMSRGLVVPISAGLLTDIRGYYDALVASREGDLNPIVQAFSAAAISAVGDARHLADDLVDAYKNWGDLVHARRDALVWRCLPDLVAQAAVSVHYLTTRFEVSEPAAQRAIDQMVEAGVLTPEGDRRRSRAWVANDVIRAHEAFAGRGRL